MNWWQKLRHNRLAQLGAVLLVLMYAVAIAAGFFAPYDPYESQANGSLLPPTTIYWRNQEWVFLEV